MAAIYECEDLWFGVVLLCLRELGLMVLVFADSLPSRGAGSKKDD